MKDFEKMICPMSHRYLIKESDYDKLIEVRKKPCPKCSGAELLIPEKGIVWQPEKLIEMFEIRN